MTDDPVDGLVPPSPEDAARNADVRPGWSGISTLFCSPAITLDAVAPGTFVAAGVPFDATASSRPGAAEGPEAVRRASRVFASYLTSLGEREMLDTRTGRPFRYAWRPLADAGDLPIYPTDPLRHYDAVTSGARRIAAAGATPIFLGGDHSVSVPLFDGVRRGCADRGEPGGLGYVQVDHHFDFGDRSAIHGSHYHGSNARRISELPDVGEERLAFAGVGDVTRREQFLRLERTVAGIATASEIRRQGVEAALDPLIEAVAERCSAVYLSIDVDVLDGSVAPGTGHVTIGGLEAAELFDALAALGRLPLAAIDVVEVAPRYDPTGRTAQLVARLLFEHLHRHHDGR